MQSWFNNLNTEECNKTCEKNNYKNFSMPIYAEMLCGQVYQVAQQFDQGVSNNWYLESYLMFKTYFSSEKEKLAFIKPLIIIVVEAKGNNIRKE